MKKLTLKNTVAEISAFLTEASKTKAVKSDKDLIARMLYTSKAIKKGEKVAKKDLLDLANDCFTVMAAAETKPKQESSLKRKPKAEKSEAQEQSKPSKSKSKTKPEAAPEAKAEEPKTKGKPKTNSKQNKAEPKSNPSTKKGEDKKQPEKKVEPKTKVFSFPEEFEDEDKVKYTRADDITDIDELRAAIEEGDNLMFAVHWTEQMLATGAYGSAQLPKKLVPKRFELDLDIMQVLYVGDLTDNITCVSLFTEAFYWWTSKDLKQTKNGRKGANLFFEIYRAEGEEE